MSFAALRHSSTLETIQVAFHSQAITQES